MIKKKETNIDVSYVLLLQIRYAHQTQICVSYDWLSKFKRCHVTAKQVRPL